jgi:hypothetical protein
MRLLVALLAVVTSSVFAQPVVDREQLLAGVSSVASAGIPGPLATTQETARVLIAGEQDGALLPVVVAAQVGKGRVLAFGHGGMLGGDALKHQGTATLVANAAVWLRGSAAQTKPIGVHDNKALEKLLSGRGLAVQTLSDVSASELALCAWVFIDAHDISAERSPVVKAFINGGGGLLTAGLGWGWLQLNPGKPIQQHPGNVLLCDAGIVWCDGYLETTSEPGSAKGFVVQALPTEVHALHVLQGVQQAAKEQEDAKQSPVSAQAAATLTSALRAVPTGDPLFVASVALLQAPQAATRARPAMSEKQPVRAKDGLSRLLVALDVELAARETDTRGAHPASAVFPGVVPAAAEREAGVLVKIAGGKRWESTGLYAPAGEVVTIELVERSASSSLGAITVQVGCHTDELWHHNAWKRVPSITRRVAWTPAKQGDKLALSSPLGGLVYVEMAKPAENVVVRVAGVVRAPLFVLGKTTAEEWRMQRGAPGPWAELASSKVIISVPSEFVRGIDDPHALMQFWDAISDAHATLATISLDPPYPHRFVADVQISAGYMHSGYPIMTHLDAAAFMTSLDTLKAGSWGLLHELGHNHQESDWTFDGTGEVTCNLFALHAIDTICTPKAGDRGHDAVNTPPSVAKHLAMGAPFAKWKQDPFLALHMYVQLERDFGWETFQKVFAEYRDLPQGQRPRNDDEKRDQWMVRFSKACGKNLGPFFEKWGVPTSEAARAEIKGLGAWMAEGME